MESQINKGQQEVMLLNVENIDKTISPKDLKLWSQLRFSAYLIFNDGVPFVAEA